MSDAEGIDRERFDSVSHARPCAAPRVEALPMPRYEQNENGTWDAIERYGIERRPASPRELQFIEAELIRSANYRAARERREKKIEAWPRGFRWLAKAWYPEPRP